MRRTPQPVVNLEVGKNLHKGIVALGLRLQVVDGTILVSPEEKVSDEFAKQLEEHRIEFLAYLVREFRPAANLAYEVLEGEFDDVDLETIVKLKEALKPFDYHLDCLRALLALGQQRVDLLRAAQGKPPVMKADKKCNCDICRAQRGDTDRSETFSSVMKTGEQPKGDTK